MEWQSPAGSGIELNPIQVHQAALAGVDEVAVLRGFKHNFGPGVAGDDRHRCDGNSARRIGDMEFDVMVAGLREFKLRIRRGG